jgi:hypothetical protein
MAVTTMGSRGYWFVHLSCIVGPRRSRICSVGGPMVILRDFMEWCIGRLLFLLGIRGITRIERLCRPEARIWGSDRVWFDISVEGFF